MLVVCMASASAHLYLMLKFSVESPLLVNAMEIWENVGVFHTKICWETDQRASWIMQQKGCVCWGTAPMGRGVCLTTAMYRTRLSFGGCGAIEKDPIKKKKVRHSKKSPHESSFYQHTSTNIQETNPKPCMNRSAWQEWIGRGGRPEGAAEVHPGLGPGSPHGASVGLGRQGKEGVGPSSYVAAFRYTPSQALLKTWH